MLTEQELKHRSKFLSLVLRHRPELIGIGLDENGWTNINVLLEKTNHHGISIDLEMLKHLVATNAKKRFAFDESGKNIRASQGHSVAVDLGYSYTAPPEILYHGTGEKSVKSILEMGLLKQGRQQVHLSEDEETARQVGQRHGKPFIFKVLSRKMYEEGFKFFLSENGVWLTDHVPVKYLSRERN